MSSLSTNSPSTIWKVWVVGISEKSPWIYKELPPLQELRSKFIEAVRNHFHFEQDSQAERTAENLELSLAVFSPGGGLVTYYGIDDFKQRAGLAC